MCTYHDLEYFNVWSRSLTVSKEQESCFQAYLGQEGLASTETDDIDALLSGRQPMLTQESFAHQLPTVIKTLPRNALH